MKGVRAVNDGELIPMVIAVPNDDYGGTVAMARHLGTQIVVVLAYLAPSIIAQRYDHQKQRAILLLNIALGWTIVGWVIALVWALRASHKQEGV